MDDQNLMALGRIEGKIDMLVANQRKQDSKLEAMDARLRTVEQKAAISGALSGGITTVGMMIAAEIVKRVM